MSVTQGTRTILTKNCITTSTTAEGNRTVLKAAADILCDITGLQIVETREHDNGALYLLGESAESSPILVFGCPNSSNYVTYVFIEPMPYNLTDSDYEISVKSTYYQMTHNLNSYDYEIMYTKLGNGDVIFGMRYSGDTSTAIYKFCITKCKTPEEKTVALAFYYTSSAGTISSTYFAGLGEVSKHPVQNLPTYLSALAPRYSYVIADLYFKKLHLPNLKYINYDLSPGAITEINGVEYIAVYYIGSGTILDKTS